MKVTAWSFPLRAIKTSAWINKRKGLYEDGEGHKDRSHWGGEGPVFVFVFHRIFSKDDLIWGRALCRPFSPLHRELFWAAARRRCKLNWPRRPSCVKVGGGSFLCLFVCSLKITSGHFLSRLSKSVTRTKKKILVWTEEVPPWDAVKGRPRPLLTGSRCRWRTVGFRTTCCQSPVVLRGWMRGTCDLRSRSACGPAAGAAHSGRTLGPSRLPPSAKWTKIWLPRQDHRWWWLQGHCLNTHILSNHFRW